jgi:electron-transferring-flavoprotein dehydrogenase
VTATPSDFPPPVAPDEFVAAPQAGEDDRLEVGVLIVGGGPAGLACAIRTGQLLEKRPELLERLGEVPIAVVDKGKVPGAHQLSGAVVRPEALRDLLPGVSMEELSSYGEVKGEAVYALTKKLAMRLIPMPPPFKNHGNHVFSLSRLTRALNDRAEELGAMILPETDAQKLLVADGAVRGILTGDKGRGREGEELATFEPGAELHAQATVLAEGTQGHLTGAAIEHFDLSSDCPQTWELGVKEVWKVAKPLTKVMHTMGWPLKLGAKWREFGGSFIYPMGDDHLCIGLVVGLDYRDASLSVHDLLQELKTHPKIAKLLEGGERVSWGAKTIPSGGFYAMPTSLSVPGAVLTGDGAGMVNVPRLKGVNYAVRSGMLAAGAIVAQLEARAEGDTAPLNLSAYDEAVKNSEIHSDLYEVRNMRQVFHKGFFLGGALSSLMVLTKGKFPGGKRKTERDADQPMADGGRTYAPADGRLTFDKLASVFASGNKTRDDQPNHVRVATRVPREVGMTWVNMCPAAVYEIAEDSDAPDGMVDVHLAPSNCVHCGAITAKGGRLTPPEGGSGPEYQLM